MRLTSKSAPETMFGKRSLKSPLLVGCVYWLLWQLSAQEVSSHFLSKNEICVEDHLKKDLIDTANADKMLICMMA